jgi:hypothetical protein
MIIKKRTEKYDRKEFMVLEYCCGEMLRLMKDFDEWSVTEDGQMSCWDGECVIGGRFCCFCGQKIVIQE